MKNNDKHSVWDVMLVRFLVLLILYSLLGMVFVFAQQIDTTAGWVLHTFVAVGFGAGTALLLFL